MNESMCRVQRGSFVYYTCRRIPVRHAFTTKFGGVSTGACESLNLGFNRGDELENVRENYRLLGETLGVDETRMTLTKQIHDTQVSVVTEDKVGMGLHRPMECPSSAFMRTVLSPYYMILRRTPQACVIPAGAAWRQVFCPKPWTSWRSSSAQNAKA